MDPLMVRSIATQNSPNCTRLSPSCMGFRSQHSTGSTHSTDNTDGDTHGIRHGEHAVNKCRVSHDARHVVLEDFDEGALGDVIRGPTEASEYLRQLAYFCHREMSGHRAMAKRFPAHSRVNTDPHRASTIETDLSNSARRVMAFALFSSTCTSLRYCANCPPLASIAASVDDNRRPRRLLEAVACRWPADAVGDVASGVACVAPRMGFNPFRPWRWLASTGEDG